MGPFEARVTRRRLLAALAAAPLAGAVAPVSAQARDGWPAIVESPGERRHGAWVWHDLVTRDADAAAAFYARVFGWSIVPHGMPGGAYRLASVNGRRVAGIVPLRDGAQGARPDPRWIGLMSVPDVDAAARRATAAGARELMAPTRLLGRGRAAVLTDPEGATFGLLRSDEGDPGERTGELGAWAWHELWVSDGTRMASWYRELGNLTVRRLSTVGDRDEWVLAQGETPRAGIVEKATPTLPSAWLPYVRVADLAATVREATAAGGRVLLAPAESIRAGRTAILADPTGAPVGVLA
jgi:predicted enzyme related to lactoylglutathione lyase